MKRSNALTGTEFRNWRALMGYSQQDAARAMGVTVRTVKRWDVNGVGKSIALCCAALYHRLEPWPHSVIPRQAG